MNVTKYAIQPAHRSLLDPAPRTYAHAMKNKTQTLTLVENGNRNSVVIRDQKKNYSWTDMERAYCVGLLNRDGMTVDELGKAIEEARPKLVLLKKWFEQNNL